jgi:hypothetical protein
MILQKYLLTGALPNCGSVPVPWLMPSTVWVVPTVHWRHRDDCRFEKGHCAHRQIECRAVSCGGTERAALDRQG